jgi:hypothetical protein
VALRTCPEWSKGMDKDNLSWVARVKVEIRKTKDMKMNWVAWVKVEVRKNKGYDLIFL